MKKPKILSPLIFIFLICQTESTFLMGPKDQGNYVPCCIQLSIPYHFFIHMFIFLYHYD